MPFIVACFLISADGKKVVSEATFKTVMFLVGSITASCCSYAVDPKTLRKGFELAANWLIINWALDLLVLVPLMVTEHTSLTLDTYVAMVPVWFLQIGFGYIGFVSTCVLVGASTERATKKTA